MTQPLLALLQSRAQHVISQKSSSAHLQALQELQGHVQKLQELENDIRAGHGDLRCKEQVFWTGNHKGKGREGINLEVRSEVLKHARATGQLQVSAPLPRVCYIRKNGGKTNLFAKQDRARYLRSLYVAQIEDGYERAIHFEPNDAGSVCEINASVRLKSQSGKTVTWNKCRHRTDTHRLYSKWQETADTGSDDFVRLHLAHTARVSKARTSPPGNSIALRARDPQAADPT